ncbi:tryptophan 2,3-dioxygenase family protein [Nevskia sp.]|uniref:tryptophan 2,3-dioxygenase n=1 Tax=Nevskia sp. TaxID=1929292 RepID=UPI0025FAEEA1|nr:tryptophan 2,3-dioxygenase family protein [Nevskia sp.]
MSAPVTYASYLQIDALLRLQTPLSDGPEHDELLFITIHQVYELWFKQLLHELRGLRTRLNADDAPAAAATLKRVLTIMKTLVKQVDVLETMTPLSFNAFRARLETSSGFQSGQFRALEFLLGHKRPALLAQHEPGSTVRAELEALLAEPSIWDCFVRHLHRLGLSMPEAALHRDPAAATVADEAVQAQLIAVYQRYPYSAQLCELLVDLDEGMQEWRYRHVKMVERTIGAKLGTGGSAGMAYLRETLFKPLFPDLWAIRTQL